MRIDDVRQGHRSLHATPLRFQVIHAKAELINNKTTGKNNARTITDLVKIRNNLSDFVNGFVSIAQVGAGVLVLGHTIPPARFGF